MKKSLYLISPVLVAGCLAMPTKSYGLATVCQQIACPANAAGVSQLAQNCQTTGAIRQMGHPGAVLAPVVVHHPRAQCMQRVAISHRGPRVLIPRVRTNIHRIVIGRTKTPTCFSPKKHSPILGECFFVMYKIKNAPNGAPIII